MARPPQLPRRAPKQARAQATQEAIFQATAQILENEGESAFTTNRVAEVAGVSVGSLYQYFPNKQAILIAMALAENAKVRALVAAAGKDRSRVAIRAQIGIWADRPATRRAALRAMLHADESKSPARESDETLALLKGPTRAELDHFVSTRAVLGVIRAAVLEGYPHMHDQGFEDALVRLVARDRD
jgi:AcrR family transcriptional regulator